MLARLSTLGVDLRVTPSYFLAQKCQPKVRLLSNGRGWKL
jgi:hypothetical protein